MAFPQNEPPENRLAAFQNGENSFFSISPPVESERPSASQGIPVVFTLCATGLTGPTQVQSRGVFPGREEMAEALSLIGAFVALSYASRWLE